ncbi:Na+/H+ antiporter NhaA [Thermostilla marina]
MSRESSNVPESPTKAFLAFLHSEIAGSVILLCCTVAALVWANSSWGGLYHDILHVKIGLAWQGSRHALTVHHWINDGLMAIFFFVVGLEVKRELVVGELSSFRKAVLPASAAIGGMVVPAALYAMLNLGGDGARGWGIPMATDIAFALGALAVFGKRVPLVLKVFLTAAAIVDDIGAVLVIAIFYTEKISMVALGVAIVLFLALFVVTRVLKINRLGIILLLIFLIWAAVLASGLHATIAGVVIAMLVPVRSQIEPKQFVANIEKRMADLRESTLTTESLVFDHHQLEAVSEIRETAAKMEPPGLVLEHYLHPVLVFFVLPVFALANAGVELHGGAAALASPIALGIILGLAVGKPVGMTLLTWFATRILGMQLPGDLKWSHIVGVGCLGGIGFTMSLFVSELAFSSPQIGTQAKIGILAGSVSSAIIGLALLAKTLPKAESGD